MDFHEALARLTRHAVFKEWKAENPESFLAHAFVMMDDANKNTWQIGFYNEKKERMVTFILTPGAVEKTEEQEVLKGDSKIAELKTQDVKLHIPDALKKAEEFFKEHYSKEHPIKQFFIIQMIDGHPMFNLTFFVQSFKTINMKIDARTGEIVKHTVQELAKFG